MLYKITKYLELYRRVIKIESKKKRRSLTEMVEKNLNAEKLE